MVRFSAGTGLGSMAAKAPRTFGEDRICIQEGCGTSLSAYNPDDYCGVHDQWTEWASLHRSAEEKAQEG